MVELQRRIPVEEHATRSPVVGKEYKVIPNHSDGVEMVYITITLRRVGGRVPSLPGPSHRFEDRYQIVERARNPNTAIQ
jgi:hypothetical protein